LQIDIEEEFEQENRELLVEEMIKSGVFEFRND